MPLIVAKGNQMVKKDVHETSNIASVWIYVEPVIEDWRSLKFFNINSSLCICQSLMKLCVLLVH